MSVCLCGCVALVNLQHGLQVGVGDDVTGDQHESVRDDIEGVQVTQGVSRTEAFLRYGHQSPQQQHTPDTDTPTHDTNAHLSHNGLYDQVRLLFGPV